MEGQHPTLIRFEEAFVCWSVCTERSEWEAGSRKYSYIYSYFANYCTFKENSSLQQFNQDKGQADLLE